MLKEGELWKALVQASQRARVSGAQKPIPTEFRRLEEEGVPFIVRVVEQLADKDALSAETARDNDTFHNPFLPYEPAMFVADISPSHVGLLNKFNVVDHHLLVITRLFEAQESPLTKSDFEAWWTCLAEFSALGFYNSSPVSGASQPHKHMQLIPLSPSQDVGRLPIEPCLQVDSLGSRLGVAETLPFVHALARIAPGKDASVSDMATYLRDLYGRMLQELRLQGTGDCPSPYNLLITRDWMMMIPRSNECFASISLNALAFAGMFLVRDEAGFQVLREAGPMTALRHAGVAR
jgi:ATP adenylyltransferase